MGAYTESLDLTWVYERVPQQGLLAKKKITNGRSYGTVQSTI